MTGPAAIAPPTTSATPTCFRDSGDDSPPEIGPDERNANTDEGTDTAANACVKHDSSAS